MSSDTNLNLDFKKLSHCTKFSFLYFCEQLYLMKHNAEHTCESAIYHNQPSGVIKVQYTILSSTRPTTSNFECR